MKDKELFIWTIYNKGAEPQMPNNFIARKFLIESGKSSLTQEGMIAPHIEMIREELRKRGFVCLSRDASDHKSIIESWI